MNEQKLEGLGKFFAISTKSSPFDTSRKQRKKTYSMCAEINCQNYEQTSNEIDDIDCVYRIKVRTLNFLLDGAVGWSFFVESNLISHFD